MAPIIDRDRLANAQWNNLMRLARWLGLSTPVCDGCDICKPIMLTRILHRIKRLRHDQNRNLYRRGVPANHLK